jgi:hypothetical protein
MTSADPLQNALELATDLPESVASHRDLVVASAVTGAMALKFALNVDKIRTVKVVDKSFRIVTLYTGSGLHRGSWNTILSPDNDEAFHLDIGNVLVDPREGMTFSTYQAMYRVLSLEARINGVACTPDNLPKSDPNYEQSTGTYLTGEPDNGNARVGRVSYDGKQTDIYNTPAQIDDDEIRFHPAVTISPELVKQYFLANPEDNELGI